MRDNPLAEFGGNARVIDRELTQFKASNPDRPDAAAANYVVWRETGRALAEAQGNQRFLLAMEGMSEGQSRMMPGAFAYNHSQPVPGGVFTRRLQLEGIESSRINGVNGLSLNEVRAATGAGWTAEVKIKGNGQFPRCVYIESIENGPYGLTRQVRFFDPTRRQIIDLDSQTFHKLTRVDQDNHITCIARVVQKPTVLQSNGQSLNSKKLPTRRSLMARLVPMPITSSTMGTPL